VEKEQALEDLSAVFRLADTAIVVDYKGLNVPQATDLRRQIRAVQGQYRVVKNTLARRASQGTNLASLEAHFEGTTAIAYTESDPVAMAKTLTAFMKTVPALQVKAAVVQGQAIKAAEVTDLAIMPGKPELYAKLLYLLNAPATNLVRVLSAVPRDFMNVLAQAEKKRA
jgi:large subunit ribosomal protein L10